MSNPKPMPRRWFGRLTLLAIGLTAVVGAVLLNTLNGEGLLSLQRVVQTLAPLLALLRLIAIAVLYLAWPSLLRIGLQRDWLTAETQQQLQSQRTRMALWLIAVELILGLEILNGGHALLSGLTR